MASLPKPKLSRSTLSTPNLRIPVLKPGLRRRFGASVVGLDIQPGHIAAVQAHASGKIVVDRAVSLPLLSDTIREGEVLDDGALGEALRELFDGSGLGRRVRIGVANQRTVLRTLDLPPVTDRKELDAAVRFQAQDQVPMPLGNAVLDYQSLGTVETPSGLRQQVVLVAAQRDMIERLLAAVTSAGLHPEGVDLSAFALIRSLYRRDEQHDGRVLYLNVDGLTNLAIAEGSVCRFTRVVGGGLEAMASELAQRHSIPVDEARMLIASAKLSGGEPLEDELRIVLENGIREIAGEVRNSLDFHRAQENGGEVSLVVLSGAALDIPGFADTLQAELGLPLQRETVDLANGKVDVSPQRLAIAAGLAVEEAPR